MSGGVAGRRVGMIVPSGNILAEDQVRAMMPAEIGLHVTRLKLKGSSTAELDAMIADLPKAADLLADARVDLIAFNCTAVSTRSRDADRAITDEIVRTAGIAAVTTAEALLAGLAVLGARSIVLVTPYIAPVVDAEAAYFRDHGLDVVEAVGAGIDSNWDMAQARPERWRELLLAHRSARADAYVLSCTAIRTHEIIGALEHEVGRPVLTSNQAIAWHATRKTGSSARLAGFGRLLAEH